MPSEHGCAPVDTAQTSVFPRTPVEGRSIRLHGGGDQRWSSQKANVSLKDSGLGVRSTMVMWDSGLSGCQTRCQLGQLSVSGFGLGSCVGASHRYGSAGAKTRIPAAQVGAAAFVHVWRSFQTLSSTQKSTFVRPETPFAGT